MIAFDSFFANRRSEERPMEKARPLGMRGGDGPARTILGEINVPAAEDREFLN
jgi:hypothetical protein